MNKLIKKQLCSISIAKFALIIGIMALPLFSYATEIESEKLSDSNAKTELTKTDYKILKTKVAKTAPQELKKCLTCALESHSSELLKRLDFEFAIAHSQSAFKIANVTTEAIPPGKSSSDDSVKSLINSVELGNFHTLYYEGVISEKVSENLKIGLLVGMQNSAKQNRKCDNGPEYQIGSIQAMIKAKFMHKFGKLEKNLTWGIGMASVSLTEDQNAANYKGDCPNSTTNNLVSSPIALPSGVGTESSNSLMVLGGKKITNIMPIFSLGTGLSYDLFGNLAIGINYKYVQAFTASKFLAGNKNIEYQFNRAKPNIEYQYGTHNIMLSFKGKL